jgi:hypothetical protein
MLSHQKHFLNVINLSVKDLLSSRIDEPEKITFCEGVIPAGLSEYDRDWLLVGLLVFVYFFDTGSPEIHLSQSLNNNIRYPKSFQWHFIQS